MIDANILFYPFALLAAVSAVAILVVRNVFYGALWLLTCLLSVAAIYVLAYAEFVAVTQILIYAGGIAVVILFGVMLTTRVAGVPLVVQHGNLFGGIVVGFTLFVLLLTLFSQHDFSTVAPAAAVKALPPAEAIGMATLTDFLLPFETAGILLLVALVGATVIAASLKSKRS